LTKEKAIELISKLLRVAAPDSGASDSERSIAAITVCSLITEHSLTVSAGRAREPLFARWWPSAPAPVPYEVTPMEHPYTPSPPRTREDPFRSAIAAENSRCGETSCGGPIFEGERVWRRVKNGAVEYVHADCWTSY
jgi:hypothetical protein